ncbi:hypothetical protein [Variovorax sp. 350MFTsu5.1]|uniref:hypothetical protein n=1 Tax=Variovorax sp. 350MFTsu5.1 TaxID=3158365 RepID=UPI003AAF4019
MNPLRRSLPDIGGLSRRLQDAVGIAVLTTAVVAGSALAAYEALQDTSGDVAIAAHRAAGPRSALERPQ